MMPRYARHLIMIAIICVIIGAFLVWATITPLSKATFYHLAGQYQKALIELDPEIKQNPDNLYAHNMRALVYGQLGQYQKAIDDQTQIIELDPNPNYPAFSNRADSYTKLAQSG